MFVFLANCKMVRIHTNIAVIWNLWTLFLELSFESLFPIKKFCGIENKKWFNLELTFSNWETTSRVHVAGCCESSDGQKGSRLGNEQDLVHMCVCLYNTGTSGPHGSSLVKQSSFKRTWNELSGDIVLATNPRLFAAWLNIELSAALKSWWSSTSSVRP